MSPADIRLRDWIVSKIKAGSTPKERKPACLALNWIIEFLAKRNKQLAETTKDDLEGFLNGRQKRGVAPDTIGRLLSTLRNIFGVLLKHGIVKTNIALEVSRPRLYDPETDFEVDQSKIDEVIVIQTKATRNYPNNSSNRFMHSRRLAILHLSADCSASCTEMADLQLSDIRTNGNVILGKGTKRERTRKLPSEAAVALQDYLVQRRTNHPTDDQSFLISHRRPFHGLDVKHIARQIMLAVNSAGMSSKVLTPRKLQRAVGAASAKAGLGWSVGLRALAYRKVPALRTGSITSTELAQLLAEHHPLGRSAR